MTLEREPLAQECLALQELIRDRCGLFFPPSRRQFLQRRLWDRMRLRGLDSYADYYRFVRSAAEGETELEELIELLLNKETQFFRYPPLFTALTQQALPQIMKAKEREGIADLTMWSAGCSSGAEAYSMAMAFMEMPGSGQWRLKVIGSDLSRACLEQARAGRYKPLEVRLLPRRYQTKYVPLIKRGAESFYQVARKVRSLTRFHQANLSDPDSFPISEVDVIFCQNVLIYFKPEIRAEVTSRLSERLRPGGYLFVAPAEAVGLSVPGMRAVRFADAVVFQRIKG